VQKAGELVALRQVALTAVPLTALTVEPAAALKQAMPTAAPMAWQTARGRPACAPHALPAFSC
jgi:hypothetical protein